MKLTSTKHYNYIHQTLNGIFVVNFPIKAISSSILGIMVYFTGPVKGFVNDEFNGFELWEDYNTTGKIFGEAGVAPTSSSNFFLFFN